MEKFRKIVLIFSAIFLIFFLSFDDELRNQIEYWGIVRGIVMLFLIILLYNIDKSIKKQEEKEKKK